MIPSKQELLSEYATEHPGEVIRKFKALGTVNSIYLPCSSYKEAAEKAALRVIDIDNRFSAFRTDSEVSKINKSAGIAFVPVSVDLMQLLKRAVYFSSISDGAFDITIAPLVSLWSVGKKGLYVPEAYEIKEAKALTGYRCIIFNEENNRVMLRRKGQMINLGGIAKGFAADEVKNILASYGINSALINLGGNIVALGRKPDGKPWTIGIQDPTKPTGAYIGTLEIHNKTLVTSGSNEQFFIKDGVRYHHILDPRTGMPADTELLSVTAVGDNSADMDALTTAIFVMGMEKGMELLYQSGAEAVFIKTDGSVYATKGLKGNFRLT